MTSVHDVSVFPRVFQKNTGGYGLPLLNVWIYFNLIVNTFLLPILVATFIFSKRARRHPTLINVCITWILSGVFSLLLFYSGHYLPNSPEPNQELCIAQASLLFGITPMWTVGLVMLVYHLTTLLGEDKPKPQQAPSNLKMIVMLSAPYVAQIGFSVAALMLSLQNPANVSRTAGFFYCALKFHPLSMATRIFTFIMCLLVILLEFRLAYLIYRNWRVVRKARQSSGMEVGLFIRVLVFGVYIIFGIVVVVISYFDERSVIPDTFAATVGAVLFLVFGTQPDVLRVWCFWKKDKEKPEAVIDLSRNSKIRYNIDLELAGPPVPSEKVTLPEKPEATFNPRKYEFL